MTEHNDPILQEALNDLADIQFCDNDHNQAVEEERQCENIIVVMASKYAEEIAAMQKDIDTLWESNGTSDKEIGNLKDEIEHLKTQLITETARQMACELECSRLAAENERLKTQLLATAERNGALELQNARMREALETIADKSNWIIESALVSDGRMKTFYTWNLTVNAVTFAHQALEENSHE